MNDLPLDPDRASKRLVEAMNAHTAIVYCYTDRVESRSSALQDIQVLDTPGFGRVLRLNGTTRTSEGDGFFYHENLVHVPAVAHPSPQHAAIIGGGDGGALRELLKHPCVESVRLVEIDPAVVEFSSRHLGSIHQGAFRDPRVTLHFCDARQWLTRTDEEFDLLVLDLTDPVGPTQALYTDAFYATCRQRLACGGVIALHVQSPVARPHAFARIVRTLRSVFTKVRPYLVFVPSSGTWLGMATVSMDLDPLCDTAEGLTHRIAARNLQSLRFYNAATHFAAFALPNFVLDLLASDVPLVTRSEARLDEHSEFSQPFDTGATSRPFERVEPCESVA